MYVANKDEMDVRTFKYVALAVLFAITFFVSLLPMRLISTVRNTLDTDKRIRYIRITNFLNSFAAGVFLGTAFLHLMPEVLQMNDTINVDFPFALFTIAVGFLVVLTLEQIVISQKDIVIDNMTPVERLEARSIELERDTLQRNLNNPQEESSRVTLIRTLQEQELEQQSCFYTFFLLVSLSLRAFYEGFKLGMQFDFNALVNILIFLLVHKVPVAFSLGLNVMNSMLNLKYVVYCSLWYSLMSPIGLVLAHTFAQLSYDRTRLDLAKYMSQGLATGIFMFVVFVEILPKELKRSRDRLLKLLALLIGFSVICVPILWGQRTIYGCFNTVTDNNQ